MTAFLCNSSKHLESFFLKMPYITKKKHNKVSKNKFEKVIFKRQYFKIF